mgnify:CR=1 FL=1
MGNSIWTTKDEWFSRKETKNIGLIDFGERMLIFFEENENGKLVSKVGSVCKNDDGADSHTGLIWTTFIKGKK